MHDLESRRGADRLYSSSWSFGGVFILLFLGAVLLGELKEPFGAYVLAGVIGGWVARQGMDIAWLFRNQIERLERLEALVERLIEDPLQLSASSPSTSAEQRGTP